MIYEYEHQVSKYFMLTLLSMVNLVGGLKYGNTESKTGNQRWNKRSI